MSYKAILFDLDGTLTDPKVGITKSVQYALRHFGKEVTDLDSIIKFIGPPLHQSFQQFYGFDIMMAEKAVEKYREYYRETGIYENEIYPGIANLLDKLKNQGKLLVVATSKPTFFANIILAYFQIDHYFDSVYGSNLDGTRSQKAEIIRDILMAYPFLQPTECLMVGDREHDLIGANHHRMDAAAVRWGYGDDPEFLRHTPKIILSTIPELSDFILQ